MTEQKKRRWNHFQTSAKTEEEILIIRDKFLEFSDLEEKDYRYLLKFLTIKVKGNGYYFFQLDTMDNNLVPMKRAIRNIFLENWDMFQHWDWEKDIKKFKNNQRDIRKKMQDAARKILVEELNLLKY